MFRANRSWACLWLSILVAFCCDCLPAQMTTGSTGGTVVDATDAVIPAAVVTLANEGTGETRKAVSGGGAAEMEPAPWWWRRFRSPTPA